MTKPEGPKAAPFPLKHISPSATAVVL